MRIVLTIALIAAALGVAAVTNQSPAQESHISIALRSSDAAAQAAEPEFRFILFYKTENPNTQRMTAELSAAVAKHPDRALWSIVNVADPNSQELVNRLQLKRAPMPLALCIAQNGAVTGVMLGKATDKAVAAALVTPTMTHCMKSLQAGKIVVVHAKLQDADTLPVGAAEFLADPSFQNRTASESFLVSDPAETRFLKDMEIDPAQLSGSSIIVLAPPGALVGKFPATATAAEIAAQLHAAGKCCNDPNCKHNHGGK